MRDLACQERQPRVLAGLCFADLPRFIVVIQSFPYPAETGTQVVFDVRQRRLKTPAFVLLQARC
jgi:hypothetical protein